MCGESRTGQAKVKDAAYKVFGRLRIAISSTTRSLPCSPSVAMGFVFCRFSVWLSFCGVTDHVQYIEVLSYCMYCTVPCACSSQHPGEIRERWNRRLEDSTCEVARRMSVEAGGKGWKIPSYKSRDGRTEPDRQCCPAMPVRLLRLVQYISIPRPLALNLHPPSSL